MAMAIRKIIYKWAIFHGYVNQPEGESQTLSICNERENRCFLADVDMEVSGRVSPSYHPLIDDLSMKSGIHLWVSLFMESPYRSGGHLILNAVVEHLMNTTKLRPAGAPVSVSCHWLMWGGSASNIGDTLWQFVACYIANY